MSLIIHHFRIILLTCIIASTAIFYTPQTAVFAAATIVGTGQPQSCTEQALRSAIANGGLIQFNCGGAATIALSAQLTISKATELDGGGTAQGGLVTLSGQNLTRIIETNNQAALIVRNLTLRDGKGTGSDGRASAIRGGWRAPVTVINSVFVHNDGTSGNQEAGGGAIFVHETTLIVEKCRFENNRGVNGGAINNLLGTLKISDSLFLNNTALGYGGGLYTDGASWPIDDGIGGSIEIRSSRFETNQAAGQGGGAFVFAYPPDSVLIDGSSFRGNLVSKDAKNTALGGGLSIGNAIFTISNVTLNNNIARSQGGGLWVDDTSRGQMTNLTVTQNQAIEDPVANKGGLGGGISSGAWSCTNCTIVDNTAGFQGGGIWGTDADMKFTNSIIANNHANNSGNSWNIKHNCGSYPSSYASDGGGNIEFPAPNSNDSSDLLCTAGALVADPKLSALADNGGMVWTMALAADSPALSIAKAPCPATDARGIARPQGTGCDSGAYECVAELSLEPASVFAGSDALTLTVMGEGFQAGDQIMWDGMPLSTEFVDNITLKANIPATQLKQAREVIVQVSNSNLAAVPFRIVSLQGQIALPLVRR